jgi:hypothetical protein
MMILVVAFSVLSIAFAGTPTRVPSVRPTRAPTAPTPAPTTASPTVKIPTVSPANKEYLNYLMYPLNSTACTGPHFIQMNLVEACFYIASASSYAIWSTNGEKVNGAIRVTEQLYSDQQCQNPVGTAVDTSFTTVCTAGSYWNYRYAYQKGREPLVPYLQGIKTDTYVGYNNCLNSDKNDIVYSYYKCHNTCVNRQLFFNCTSSGYRLQQYNDAQCKSLNFAKSYTLSDCKIAPTMNNQYIQAACFGPVTGNSGGGRGSGGQGVPRKVETRTGAGHWSGVYDGVQE